MRHSFAILVLPLPTSADIAPMTYDTYNLATISSCDIRMAAETVDITILDRLSPDAHHRRVRVEAVFRTSNESEDTVVVEAGFPVFSELGGPAWSPDEKASWTVEKHGAGGIYDFYVAIDDGEPFEPGAKIVFGDFTARITIQFLDEVGRVFLSRLYPPGYERGVNTVSWCLANDEPDWDDVVLVEFLPPEVLASIREIEELERLFPSDLDILMALAHQYMYAAKRTGAETVSPRLSETGGDPPGEIRRPGPRQR